VSDLLVDYLRLATLGQQLANLRGEFNAGHDAIGPLLGTLSDGNLRAKLQDFTNNWSDERAKLTEHLDKAAGFAITAAACYLKVDETLAQAASGGR
jgi:hypothetical protein